MKNDEFLDLYSDYLLSAFGPTTATGLSALLEGQVSHDQIQRFLASSRRTSADLWRIVKAHIRKIERKDAVMIVDDSIAEKPYTDENELISWHYDHSKDRMIKGINFITALYHSAGWSLPVGFELIAKTESYVDPKDGKEKRRSKVTKNELYQKMLKQVVRNQILFHYVLSDVWFAAADNMMFVKHELKKHFVMPLHSNRKVAPSARDKRHGRFVSVDTLKTHIFDFIEAGSSKIGVISTSGLLQDASRQVKIFLVDINSGDLEEKTLNGPSVGEWFFINVDQSIKHLYLEPVGNKSTLTYTNALDVFDLQTQKDILSIPLSSFDALTYSTQAVWTNG